MTTEPELKPEDYYRAWQEMPSDVSDVNAIALWYIKHLMALLGGLSQLSRAAQTPIMECPEPNACGLGGCICREDKSSTVDAKEWDEIIQALSDARFFGVINNFSRAYQDQMASALDKVKAHRANMQGEPK